MIQLSISQAQRRFFDRNLIKDSMDKASLRALSRGGALIMRQARKSIKNAAVMARGRVREGERRQVVRFRSSQPGQPPFSRTGLLRDKIYFVAAGKLGDTTVRVGPVLIGRPTGAPDTLEFGGNVSKKAGTMMVRSGRDANGRFQPDRRVKVGARTVHIEARPYMGPALDNLLESNKLPDMWKGAMGPQ